MCKRCNSDIDHHVVVCLQRVKSVLVFSVCSKTFRASESPVVPMSVTPFCAAELQRALTEQTFAIKNSMI